MKFKYKNTEVDVKLTNKDFLKLEESGRSMAKIEHYMQEDPIRFSLDVLSLALPQEPIDEILESMPIVDLVTTAASLINEGMVIPLSESRKGKKA